MNISLFFFTSLAISCVAVPVASFAASAHVSNEIFIESSTGGNVVEGGSVVQEGSAKTVVDIEQRINGEEVDSVHVATSSQGGGYLNIHVKSESGKDGSVDIDRVKADASAEENVQVLSTSGKSALNQQKKSPEEKGASASDVEEGQREDPGEVSAPRGIASSSSASFLGAVNRSFLAILSIFTSMMHYVGSIFI